MGRNPRDGLVAWWTNVPLRGKGLTVVSIPIIALIVAAMASLLLQRQADEADAHVAHTLEVLNTIQRTNVLLLDAVIGTRSYLLTGREEALQTYIQAQAALPDNLAHLTLLVADNPTQRERTAQLSALASQQMALLNTIQTSTDTPGGTVPAATRALLIQNDEKLGAVRTEVAAMQADEEGLLAERTAVADRLRRRGIITVAISLLFGLVGGGFATLLFASGIANRIRRLEDNAARMARRDRQLPTPGGNDEIGQLGDQLVEADRLLHAWERELRAAQVFREHLIAASPGLIYRVTLGDRPSRYVSPNVYHLLGYTPEEVVDTPQFWIEHIHNDDQPGLQIALEPLYDGTHAQTEYEQRLLAKNGQYRWFYSVFRIERDAGDEPQGAAPATLLTYSVEITARKEAEAALVQAKEELERRVQERTRDLHTANLRLAQRQDELEELTATLQHQAHSLEEQAAQLAATNRDLAQKNEENEMFVYSVSHDLRSPLVNLQGFSQELALVSQDLRALLTTAAIPQTTRDHATALLDGDMADALRFIQAAVSRLSAIIDALLRLSRAGRLEYQWQLVDVAAVVRRVVDALHETITARGAQVTVGPLAPIWGDPTALEQVFANLLGNALAYLDPARPGQIEVRSTPSQDEQTPTVVYSVRDNGLGIPEHAQEKVFQIFQRVHPQAAPGEGLGLALVRRIVERHQGTIGVESTEGVGSTFSVVLHHQDEEVRCVG